MWAGQAGGFFFNISYNEFVDGSVLVLVMRTVIYAVHSLQIQGWSTGLYKIWILKVVAITLVANRTREDWNRFGGRSLFGCGVCTFFHFNSGILANVPPGYTYTYRIGLSHCVANFWVYKTVSSTPHLRSVRCIHNTCNCCLLLVGFV